ncbi:hypothetical protein RJ640_010051 [Escallonia rubra]|uniref:Synaptotagmin-5 n=1 Tax=Escallonia rubra TaxID=112253 RepID=A0AA88RGJ4_9ASTE|nr:hypothetical protein RJ640_010051 [Escallonia rubra]
MAFFFGLVVGFTVGLALIVGFVRSENARSKRRSELAMGIASLARMTVEDSKKILIPEYYPSWVVFSNRQKLSDILAASELIKANVEPILEQYRPVISSSLKFSKFTLGTVAPQFTGVSILEDGSDGITMELEMQWDGNPSIILDIKTRLGVALPVQVKNIAFTGVFRLIFKPLVDAFPCFGAVCFSLREKLYPDTCLYLAFSHLFICLFQWQKKLDFTLKVIGGDISAIPGLSGAIEETIRDAVEDSITWPVRKVIPILPGDYRYLPSIFTRTPHCHVSAPKLYLHMALRLQLRAINRNDLSPTTATSHHFPAAIKLKPVGVLEVKLVQAKELTNKDLIGKSDPFAKLYIRPLRNRMKTSKTINNQLSPVWNEHFEFIVEDTSTQHLVVKIYDDEGFQSSELIGCAQIGLRELEPGKVKDVWLKLVKDLELQRDNKNRGQVHLELLYYPFGMENGFTNPFAPTFSMTSLEKVFKNGTEAAENGSEVTQKRRDLITRGVLSVTVISAEDLTSADLVGKADPYCVLVMKKTGTKNKTRVVNDSLNPVWNQSFDFLVEDGLHDMLTLEVWDHDTFGKDYMGMCILTLTRVILEGEYKDSFQLDGTKSGKVNLHLKWMPQSIYRDS